MYNNFFQTKYWKCIKKRIDLILNSKAMDDKAEVLYSHFSGQQCELKTNKVHRLIQAILID